MGKDGNLETATPDDADLLRLIFESAKDFAVFAENASGEVILWNAGAEHLTGYSEDDILSLGGDVIFTPEDRAAGAPDHERSQELPISALIPGTPRVSISPSSPTPVESLKN